MSGGDSRAVLGGVVIGSVGPSSSEGLRNLGIELDFEPENVKMVSLVRLAASEAAAMLARNK